MLFKSKDTHTTQTTMRYNLTYDSHTWTFSDHHGLDFEFPSPLTVPELIAAVPQWHSKIPERLMLDEDGNDQTCKSFSKFLKTDIGAIVWQLFKYTAYHLPIDNNVNRLTKAAVVTSLNTSGNKIMYIPGVEIQEVIERLFQTDELYGFEKAKCHILGRSLSTMFVRLFNYYECYERNLTRLFNMVPRNSPAATCPACQTVFDHTGKVIIPPSEDVNAATWTAEDAFPGGFGWFPGSDEGTGFERKTRRPD